MKRSRPLWIASLAVVPYLVSCASSQPEPSGPPGQPLEPFTSEQILAEANSLMRAKGIDERGQTILEGRLRDLLAEDEVKELMRTKGATAVGVFHSAGGGFLIKGNSGEGLVSFHPEGRAAAFKVSGLTVGAVIGGGSNHGIFLAFGLRDQRRFAGNYTSRGVKVTGLSAGVSAGILDASGGDHEMRYLATGAGMSADAGVGSMTVEMVN